MSEFAFILDRFPIPLLAVDEMVAGSWWETQWRTLRSLQFDLPTTGRGWALYLGGFAAALVVIVWMYLRDTAMLGSIWRFWLLGLRLLVVAALAVIALNPHFREEETLYRPSQVAVLLDTSFSMRLPASAPPTETQPEGSPPARSRADAAIELFAKSPMLRELRQRHEVHVYTFDTRLEGPHRIFKSDEQLEREARLAAEEAADESTDSASAANDETGTNGEPGDDASTGDPAAEDPAAPAEIAEIEIDWEELLAPRGQETRLGEALYELIVKMQGDTLSGIMVVSDGGSNAGYEPRTANEAAVKSRPPVKLVAVGVGGTDKQPNLRVANLQAPTQVHMGDPFDLVALVSGNEMAGRGVEIELLVQADDRGDEEPRVVARQSVTLAEDGVPVEVAFREVPELAGKFRYSVRVRPTTAIRELREDDNRMDHVAEVVDRKTRVLIIAGGPTREYQFVRNMLYRHSGVELDIWLQTVDRASFPRVSQEADELLLEFPKDQAELFQYDVIVAFDPDWRRIPAEGLQMLERWVFAGSGLVAVAGDVYTPEMVSDDPALEPIKTLYPVFLRPYLLDLQFDRDADQAYAVGFSDEGRNAGFLQIVDDPAESRQAWDEFPGVYGAYPTRGAKAGATVYAYFSDARSQNEYGLPILMAGQLYGAGRTFYLGSGEIWRIRSKGEEYYDRFWTKVIRDAGQGRFRTGGSRAQFVLDRNVYALGETVRVRVRLHDAQYQPVDVAQVPVQLFDPNGRPRVPPLSLERDPHRPGQYVGEFRANTAGNYELELAVPDSTETQNASIQVRLPNLEDDRPEQDAALLAELVKDTGGRYIAIEQAAVAVPSEFDFKGSETTISEQLKLAWDKAWVMYVLVGLLSLEWLTRKLLKLA
ncbi:MAG: hypothetical protein WD066_10880 [Planctomycetaceae bacterium]